MNVLKRPSPDLAKRVLREVRFEDRVEGYNLKERAGGVRVIMYSLAGVVSFLNERHPRIDLHALEGWVRDVIGDAELADRMEVALATPVSDQAKGDKVRKLIEERLRQCEKAVTRL